jgi:hypothetical protein
MKEARVLTVMIRFCGDDLSSLVSWRRNSVIDEGAPGAMWDRKSKSERVSTLAGLFSTMGISASLFPNVTAA